MRVSAVADTASVDEDASVTVDPLVNDTTNRPGYGRSIKAVWSPFGAATTDGSTINYTPAPDSSGEHIVYYKVRSSWSKT